MIHSARPIVTPVVNIVFCCFVFLDLKGGDVRTYGQHVRKQLFLPAVTLGWPSGSKVEKHKDVINALVNFMFGYLFLIVASIIQS